MEWNGSRARTELMAAPELPRKVLGHRLSGASTPPRRQTSCRDDRWATQGRGVKSLLAGTAAHRFQAPPRSVPAPELWLGAKSGAGRWKQRNF
jgi:hypothetical protein